MIWLLLGILFVMVVSITFFILDIKKDKHFIETREVINGTKFLIKRRARDYIDVDGGNFWKIRGESDLMKKYIGSPPKESILIDNKGKKHVTIYRDESGSYSFQKDGVIELGDEKDLQPLTTSQRIIYVSNQKRAINRGSNGFAKNLPIIVGVAGIILILAIALLFTPDVMDALKGRYSQMEKMNQVMLEIVKTQQDMSKNIQTISGNEINVLKSPKD